jgi:hypothetical protein
MDAEIGTIGAQFLFWEYINGIFVAVYHKNVFIYTNISKATIFI